MIRGVMDDTAAVVERMVQHIDGYRYNFVNEDELQQGVATALGELELRVEREKILNATDRIDFLVNESIGVECKIDGSLSNLTRQLHRYAQLPEIKALILVTNRNRLSNLPNKMNGKLLHVVNLRSSAF